jgi:disulfide bond formation protein DsbB
MSNPAVSTNPLLLLLIVGLATISGAWAFQIYGDLVPCPLCFIGRWQYYAGLPLALLALLLATGNVGFARILLALVALVFLAGAIFAVWHAGIEWKFWPGPDTCASGVGSPSTAGGLLNQMRSTRVVPCDEAAWRLFGISLAGYNAIISAGIAVLALRARKE